MEDYEVRDVMMRRRGPNLLMELALLDTEVSFDSATGFSRDVELLPRVHNNSTAIAKYVIICRLSAPMDPGYSEAFPPGRA
jgi:hypothetical protein